MKLGDVLYSGETWLQVVADDGEGRVQVRYVLVGRHPASPQAAQPGREWFEIAILKAQGWRVVLPTPEVEVTPCRDN
jgi:hypothetical protein